MFININQLSTLSDCVTSLIHESPDDVVELVICELNAGETIIRNDFVREIINKLRHKKLDKTKMFYFFVKVCQVYGIRLTFPVNMNEILF